MKKSVLFLVFILFSSSVFAYAFSQSVPSYDPFKSYEDSSGGLEKSPYYSPQSNGFPDLVISRVILPDELPLYSMVTNFEVEIKNVGAGVAHGDITIRLTYDSFGIPRCTQTIYAGGTFGSANPWYGSQTMKVTDLWPNQTLIVPVYYNKVGVGVPRYCQKALQGDLTVIAEVNPAGGYSSKTPRGRILESDATNNIGSKTVKVSANPSKTGIVLNFKPDVNVFSLPVVTDLTNAQFFNRTRCNLFYTSESNFNNLRKIDFSSLSAVPMEEKLVPGKAYFARCSAYVSMEVFGTEPDFFNKKVVGNNNNLITTRLGMMGKRIYEFAQGCGISYSGGRAPYFRFVPGQKHTGLGAVVTETLPWYQPVVPGDVYVMFCEGTYGGVWDPPMDSYPGDAAKLGTRSSTMKGAVAFGSGDKYLSRALTRGGYVYTYGGSGKYS